jgi:hypothetical protein
MSGVCAVLLVLTSFPDGFPLLSEADVRPAVLDSVHWYHGGGLTGYINGGAELYREYGFVELAVQEVTSEGGDVTAEIYRMTDPVAAFGVFSTQRSFCVPVDSSLPFSCSGKSSVKFASGPYFVRIMGSGSMLSTGLLRTLALTIAGRISERTDPLPPVFRGPVFGPQAASVRAVRGPLGLQAVAPERLETLDGLFPAEIFLLSLEGEDGSMTAGVLRFPDRDRMMEFLRRYHVQDPRENLLGISANELEGGRAGVLEEQRGAQRRAVKRMSDTECRFLETQLEEATHEGFREAFFLPAD